MGGSLFCGQNARVLTDFARLISPKALSIEERNLSARSQALLASLGDAESESLSGLHLWSH
jgi:hypothetical protein